MDKELLLNIHLTCVRETSKDYKQCLAISDPSKTFHCLLKREQDMIFCVHREKQASGLYKKLNPDASTKDS